MCNKLCSCLIAALVSVVIGIILGIFSFLVAIPGIIIALLISLGIGILGIIIVLVLSLVMNKKAYKCICNNGKCLAFGAVGSVVTAIIGLSIIITPLSFLSAIFVGFAAFFLSLTLISILQLLLCLTDCNRCKEE